VNQEEKNAHALRSKGEAHLYIAVAKADGQVSRMEKIRAPFFARKSQKHYNMFDVNKEVLARIGNDVTSLLADPVCNSWDAHRHVTEAVEILKRVKRSGIIGVDVTAEKIEKELFELAYLDGYNMKESRFVKECIATLQRELA